MENLAVRISEELAERARNKWDADCSRWGWKEDELEDVRLALAEMLSGLPDEDSIAKVLDEAWLVESWVRQLNSSDEAQYSCAGMKVDPDLFRRGVKDMRDDYLCMLEGDPGAYASDEEIMGMGLEDDRVDFPFGQSFIVERCAAWPFLERIGIDPYELAESVIRERTAIAPLQA